MAKLNSSYRSDLQSRTFNEKIEISKNTVDLDYEGFNAQTDTSIERYGVSSHVNRVLMWLASKPNDYVREPGKGGPLWTMLSKRMIDTNMKLWENSLSNRFEEEFSGELELVYLKLTADKTGRGININMVVRDAITREAYTVMTTAEY